MHYDAKNGLIQGITFRPSPNQDKRPEGEISLLVVHGISLPPKEFGGDYVNDLFLNQLALKAHPYFASLEGVKVSAHFFIRRTGDLIQYVPVTERAWHAGESCFKGRTKCNDFSIGIELEGCDDMPYEDIQTKKLVELVKILVQYYPAIKKDHIVGHSDIAPGRKTDPGPFFSWQRFWQLWDETT